MGAFINGSVFINQQDRVVVIGSKVIPFHEKMSGTNVTTINNKLYIDGYEYMDGKWKRTLWALWHKMF